MKKIIRNLLASITAATLAVASLTASAQNDPNVGGAPMYPNKTIVQNAVNSPIS